MNGYIRADLPVVGSFGQEVVPKVNDERTINWYETASPQGKKPTYLTPWPGKALDTALNPEGKGRASFLFKGDGYHVVGRTIYKNDLAIGTDFFDSSSGYVGIAANEHQVIFVDDAKAFLWDTNTNLEVTVTLPPDTNPLDVTYMDGRFILISSTAGKQNRFYISELNDGATWIDTNFALVNARPTILSAVAVLKRAIFFFGNDSSEIWGDAGAADFPFRRDNTLLLEHGVQAIGSVVEGFNRLFYLSSDADGVGSIMMADGNTEPRPISTRQLDEVIQGFSETNKASAFVMKINGQIFYQINFARAEDGTGDRTFIYNVDTDRWHEAAMLDGKRDIAQTHIYQGGKHLALHYDNGNLYEISSRYFHNVTENMKRTRIMRLLSVPTYDRVVIDRIQIDMLQGVGVQDTKPIHVYPPGPVPVAAADVQPKLFLSISEDGGITFDDMGSQDIGASGERLTRTMWRNLGARRDAICKFEMYSAVPAYVLGGAFDYKVLDQ